MNRYTVTASEAWIHSDSDEIEIAWLVVDLLTDQVVEDYPAHCHQLALDAAAALNAEDGDAREQSDWNDLHR